MFHEISCTLSCDACMHGGITKPEKLHSDENTGQWLPGDFYTRELFSPQLQAISLSSEGQLYANACIIVNIKLEWHLFEQVTVAVHKYTDSGNII